MDQLEPPKTSKETITDIYLVRPVDLRQMTFGSWFCLSAGVADDLLKTLDLDAGLQHIENAGYNYFPRLVPRLEAFNFYQGR